MEIGESLVQVGRCVDCWKPRLGCRAVAAVRRPTRVRSRLVAKRVGCGVTTAALRRLRLYVHHTSKIHYGETLARPGPQQLTCR